MKKYELSANDVIMITSLACILFAIGSLVWAIATGQVDTDLM